MPKGRDGRPISMIPLRAFGINEAGLVRQHTCMRVDAAERELVDMCTPKGLYRLRFHCLFVVPELAPDAGVISVSPHPAVRSRSRLPA